MILLCFCQKETARTNLLSWINQGSLAGVVQLRGAGSIAQRKRYTKCYILANYRFVYIFVNYIFYVHFVLFVCLFHCITASLSDRPAVKLGSGLPPSSKIWLLDAFSGCPMLWLGIAVCCVGSLNGSKGKPFST